MSSWLVILGLLGTVMIGIMVLFADDNSLLVPGSFAFLGAVLSYVVHRLAKAELIHGRLAFVVFPLYASIPTFVFIVGSLLLEDGIATFITGPMSYLYCPLILVSACLFDYRYPIVVGLFIAASYFVCAWFAIPVFEAVQYPSEALRSELTNIGVWANKSMMFLFIGLTAGSLASVGRRLSQQTVAESRKRDRVRRLFGKYVSAQVVERVMQNEGEPQRVHAAILFSDIRGFTTFSETADAGELVRRLNEYFQEMVSAVHENGGIVDKLIGDAVMAVFGGVADVENPSDSAVLAAQSMVRRLERLNIRWAAEGKVPWAAGIGIHVGDVVMGGIGSNDRKDFTVIGDAVNTAARLEGLTKEYVHPILISRATRNEMADASGWVRVGELPIRGRKSALEVFADDSMDLRSDTLDPVE
jgi:class 3 adenylate cyclase